jgi:2-isopropylmalate synthase
VSAFMNAIKTIVPHGFSVEDYDEQALGKGADAMAVAYVPLKLESGKVVYGVGIDTNIDQAAIQAILAALNRTDRKQQAK